MTNTAMLALIDAAITAILTGNVQSYSINGRQFTRLNLKDLWTMRTETQAAVNSETSGSFFVAQAREPE